MKENKLSREELMGWLNTCWSLYKTSQDEWGKSQEAYEQIKSILQQKPTESRIINCPSCGRIWNLETHSACQCGAIIKMPTKFESDNWEDKLDELINEQAEIMCNFRSAPKVFKDYKLAVKFMFKRYDELWRNK